jgi:hypothetical protein
MEQELFEQLVEAGREYDAFMPIWLAEQEELRRRYGPREVAR